jgi:hypothetical protein
VTLQRVFVVANGVYYLIAVSVHHHSDASPGIIRTRTKTHGKRTASATTGVEEALCRHPMKVCSDKFCANSPPRKHRWKKYDSFCVHVQTQEAKEGKRNYSLSSIIKDSATPPGFEPGRQKTLDF